ncbi:MAG TPA: AsmA-like C-terminal region-containing protein, partial [Candidatus Didemnitutus sp.]|nr:AsmA-like C-terminal region-containing protein [Candidatus Didemnitutus sp.]
LKLDAARSSFQLRDGRMHFPDLKITGPSAVIDAQGDYLLDSKSLDFSARLKPYEEMHNPLTAPLGVILNSITRIFELKLTGPLAKPDWSVTLGGGGAPKPAATTPTPPPNPTQNPSPAPEPPADKK